MTTLREKNVQILHDARCKKCNKLLGRVNGAAEIKCPKCKTFNLISNK